MCCGNKREELRSAPSAPPAKSPRIRPAPEVPHAAAAAAVPYRAIEIRYVDHSRIRVRGPVTGRQYEFSESSRVQPVDPRDAASLLQSRFFRRV